MNLDRPLVCDASVVLNLGRRGSLTGLVGELKSIRPLAVTEQVEAELHADDSAFYSTFLADHFQIIRGPLLKLPQVEEASQPDGLDAGEMSVLALCLEREWVPAIDERIGRNVARKLKMEPVGTLGLLKLAWSKKWMTEDECLDAIRRLRTNGFYCPKVLANDDLADYMARLK